MQQIIQIILDFYEPLIKHKFRIVSASIIVGILLYIGTDIVLAETVRQNSYDISMLEANLLIESNPNFANVVAKDEEMKILSLFTDLLEQRKFASVIRLLYPAYNPGKILAPAMKALENAQTEEEVRGATLQAGLACERLYTVGERFPRSPIKWFASEDVTPWLKEFDSALAESRKMVKNLEDNQTADNAKAAFAANMKTMLSLFLAARLGSGSDSEVISKKINDFRNIVKQSQEYTNNVANKETNIKTRGQILICAENEQRQIDILNATSGNRMDGVSHLLRKMVKDIKSALPGDSGPGSYR